MSSLLSCTSSAVDVKPTIVSTDMEDTNEQALNSSSLFTSPQSPTREDKLNENSNFSFERLLRIYHQLVSSYRTTLLAQSKVKLRSSKNLRTFHLVLSAVPASMILKRHFGTHDGVQMASLLIFPIGKTIEPCFLDAWLGARWWHEVIRSHKPEECAFSPGTCNAHAVTRWIYAVKVAYKSSTDRLLFYCKVATTLLSGTTIYFESMFQLGKK